MPLKLGFRNENNTCEYGKIGNSMKSGMLILRSVVVYKEYLYCLFNEMNIKAIVTLTFTFWKQTKCEIP